MSGNDITFKKAWNVLKGLNEGTPPKKKTKKRKKNKEKKAWKKIERDGGSGLLF